MIRRLSRHDPTGDDPLYCARCQLARTHPRHNCPDCDGAGYVWERRPLGGWQPSPCPRCRRPAEPLAPTLPGL